MTDNLEAHAVWKRREPNFDMARVSEVEGFERFIQDRVVDGELERVFLATDNADVEARLRARFPDAIVVYPKRYRAASRSRLSLRTLRRQPVLQRTSIIGEALIEMLLLSRCSRIVGTYWSSFAHVSAVWSGVPFSEIQGEELCENELVARHQGFADVPGSVGPDC